MTRGVSGNYQDEIAGRITASGYFVEIIFKNYAWLGSSRGDLTLPGVGESGPSTAPAAGITVSGLATDGSQSSQTGSITILDPDGVLAAKIVEQGIGDKRVIIQSFYGDGPQDAQDYVTVFDGVGDDADIDPASRNVTIRLQQLSGRTLYSPRRYMTRENGFSVLPPDGTVLTVGNETYTIQASDQ